MLHEVSAALATLGYLKSGGFFDLCQVGDSPYMVHTYYPLSEIGDTCGLKIPGGADFRNAKMSLISLDG